MANGDKNNGKKEIELLPVELRRPEDKRKKTEKEDVKFFVPTVEEKPKGPAFMGKIFSREEKFPPDADRVGVAEKNKGAELSVFKMQKETRHPTAAVPQQVSSSPKPPTPPPPPPKSSPPPRPLSESRPKTVPPQPLIKAKLSSPTTPLVPKKKFGITLIPEEKVGAEEARKSRRGVILVAIVIVMLVIFGGLYFGLRWSRGLVSVELKRVEADLAVINQKIKDVEERKNQAQALQKQLTAANKLLGEHLYWTNIFSFLEKNTVAEVYFLNFVGGSDGQINLSGIAKNYKAVARQIVALRAAENVDKIFVSSASASVDPAGKISEVNFDAKIKFNPEIFLK